MTNQYYGVTGAPVAQSRGSSGAMRSEFTAIQAGFDALAKQLGGASGIVIVFGANGGAANAYTVTPATAITAYTANMLILFTPTTTNTGASTINVSGIGAIAVKQIGGADTVPNDLAVGTTYSAVYNGTYAQLLSTTKNYADQLAFNTALPEQPGDTFQRSLYTLSGVAAWGRVYQKVDVVTTSDTWTCPDGVTSTEVWCTGGGAACGTGNNANAGGTSGSTGMKVFTVVPGTAYARTIGAGGAAVLTATTAGNAGGTSSFSGSGITTLSCPGGPANGAGVIAGAAGLNCTGADLNIPGGVSSGAVVGFTAGNGGDSYWGGCTRAGTDAIGYGCGSGGVYNGATGFAGKQGIIIQRY